MSTSFNRHVDQYTHDFLMAIYEGATLADAMKELTLAHAEHLRELGDVRVLALDPCPRCTGRVIATDEIAKCAAGCGWTYRRKT